MTLTFSSEKKLFLPSAFRMKIYDQNLHLTVIKKQI